MNAAPLPARNVPLWLPIAILAGGAAPFVRSGQAGLAPPSFCTGLPDLVGVLLARMAPSTSPFPTLRHLDTLLLVVGVVAFVRLAQRVCGGAVVGAAVALSVIALPTLVPYLAVLPAAGLVIAASSVAVLWPTASGTRHTWPLWVTMALTAAIWPALTAIAIATFVAAMWVRGERGGMAVVLPAAAIGGVGILITLAVPPLPSAGMASRIAACAAPAIATLGPTALLAHLSSLAMSVGPYVCGLALLGLFLSRGAVVRMTTVPVAIYLLGSLTSAPPRELLAWPIVIGLGAAMGLRELVGACRPGIGGRIAAYTLVMLVPVLGWESAVQRRAVSQESGHGSMTLLSFSRVLTALPENGRLVSEDASTALLLRAAQSRSDLRVPPTVERDALMTMSPPEQALRLFALPSAQRDLQVRGFRLVDTPVSGLAEVQPGGACRLATSEWRTFDGLSSSTAIAIVARQLAEAGPVVIYARFDGPPTLDPLDWPVAALRGFYTTIYAPDHVDEQQQLRDDIAGDGLPVDAFPTAQAYVARLELWRIPSAPLALATGLGAVPTQVIARVIAHEEPRRLTLCPAFPHSILPLAP